MYHERDNLAEMVMKKGEMQGNDARSGGRLETSGGWLGA